VIGTADQNYQFPAECPTKACPPEDAVPTNGRIWRIVKNDPPTADDFQTYLELGKAMGAAPCRRCGLSVQITEKDARHMAETFNYLGNHLASANLGSDRGVVRQTGRVPHHTWWPDERTPRYAGFEVG